MRVTSKGQVTIPQQLREQAGILPGSEVEFRLEKGQLVIHKKRSTGRGEALIKLMTGAGDVKMTTDEILRLTRGDR